MANQAHLPPFAPSVMAICWNCDTRMLAPQSFGVLGVICDQCRVNVANEPGHVQRCFEDLAQTLMMTDWPDTGDGLQAAADLAAWLEFYKRGLRIGERPPPWNE